MKTRLFMCFLVALMPFMALAQTKNTISEVKDYREIDGKIVISCLVNGEEADFVLDLAGQSAILPEYVEKLKIAPDSRGRIPYNGFQYKKVLVTKTVSINSISFGNSAFANGMAVFVLDNEPYLRELGVAGIMGGSLFRNVVLTIDSRRKKITMSQPYRPTYMKLDHRISAKLLQGSGMECQVMIDGMAFSCILDTWTNGLVEFNESDFARLKSAKGDVVSISTGYAKALESSQTKNIEQCDFVREAFKNVSVPMNFSLVRSVLGAGILKYGILSLDYLRQTVYFQPFDLGEVKDDVIENHVVVESGKMNDITGAYFREHIHDYMKGTDFIFKGDKPVVIDFWASWCGPCMKLLPVMEQLAAKYKDQVIFLKVNADKEKELCNKFNISALPTLFFLPVNGKPIVEIGAAPTTYEKIIEQLLK